MDWMETLFGSPGKQGSTYNKNQLSAFDQMLEQVMSMRGGGQTDITQNQNYQSGQDWLQSLFNDQGFFNKFEAPMQRQFEENTGDLANRFAGMGSGGSLGSTGFRNQANREAGNLSQNMAAMRGGMQQQGANQALQYGQQPINNFMQMFQQAMQPTQNTYTPATAGLAGPVLGSFAEAAGKAWGGSF